MVLNTPSGFQKVAKLYLPVTCDYVILFFFENETNEQKKNNQEIGLAEFY